MMTAGPKPTLQLLRFCVSLISVTLFGQFSRFLTDSSPVVSLEKGEKRFSPFSRETTGDESGFLRFTGLSKFSFTKFRFVLCSPSVTVKVLFVPINSIVGGSIARLCSNSVGRSNPKLFNL